MSKKHQNHVVLYLFYFEISVRVFPSVCLFEFKFIANKQLKSKTYRILTL